MRPAVLNVVTHEANHILNRGADYFWCSRKAIQKIGQSVNDLSPTEKLEYNKRCNFFVFLNPPNKLSYGKTHVAIASTHRFNCPATMAIETLEATSYFLTIRAKINIIYFIFMGFDVLQ
ncbi:hypothetical protein OUZ56_025164 [Daphnia magna]|uniref:Uncharacterized protein n=1 Tax=Daphnia magna TaxID=35525 RepID=A0ABQ9ZJ12_9CRUS|nr:hypothetical protein OUZ56_025164 [Daphnia magna]